MASIRGLDPDHHVVLQNNGHQVIMGGALGQRAQSNIQQVVEIHSIALMLNLKSKLNTFYCYTDRKQFFILCYNIQLNPGGYLLGHPDNIIALLSLPVCGETALPLGNYCPSLHRVSKNVSRLIPVDIVEKLQR